MAEERPISRTCSARITDQWLVREFSDARTFIRDDSCPFVVHLHHSISGLTFSDFDEDGPGRSAASVPRLAQPRGGEFKPFALGAGPSPAGAPEMTAHLLPDFAGLRRAAREMQ